MVQVSNFGTLEFVLGLRCVALVVWVVVVVVTVVGLVVVLIR